MFSYRKVYFYLFLLCVVVMSFAFYLQYVMGVEPCLLCMLQRLFFVLLGLLCLLASLHPHNRLSRWIYNSLTLLLSLLGGLVAVRQVWLQYLPPQQAASTYCLPGGETLLHSASWATILNYLMQGDSDCSKVLWSLLGLSIAEWSLIIFAIIFLVILFRQCRRQSRTRKNDILL